MATKPRDYVAEDDEQEIPAPAPAPQEEDTRTPAQVLRDMLHQHAKHSSLSVDILALADEVAGKE